MKNLGLLAFIPIFVTIGFNVYDTEKFLTEFSTGYENVKNYHKIQNYMVILDEGLSKFSQEKDFVFFALLNILLLISSIGAILDSRRSHLSAIALWMIYNYIVIFSDFSKKNQRLIIFAIQITFMGLVYSFSYKKEKKEEKKNKAE